MRIPEVLAKTLPDEFRQVEGFLGNRRLGFGKQTRIDVGQVGLNFFCKNCNDQRTFCSGKELYCLGVNDHLVSIDCVLKCSTCESSVQAWFLVESEDEIYSPSPKVRVIRRSENLSASVSYSRDRYGRFSELLEKSEEAYSNRLGAGSVVYLRKIYEQITVQVAKVRHINVGDGNGRRRNFSSLLREVDGQCHIIPSEYTKDGYKLFSYLSEIIHGDFDENLALEEYGALRQLVIGIIENVRKNEDIMRAIRFLGWPNQGELP